MTARPISENKSLIGGRRPDMTMLYRSTDRLCRRGASMKNLAQVHPLIRRIRMPHQNLASNS